MLLEVIVKNYSTRTHNNGKLRYSMIKDTHWNKFLKNEYT